MNNNHREKGIEGILAIEEIFISIKVYATYLLYYHKEASPDLRAVGRENPFISDGIVAFWRILILDLCKLFVDKDMEKYNLHKYLRDILNSDPIETEGFANFRVEASKWACRLKQPPLTKYTSKAKTLRDKVYAHKDRVPPETIYLNLFSADEIEDWVNTTEVLVKLLANNIRKIDPFFHIHGLEEAGGILNKLKEHKEWLQEKLDREFEDERQKLIN